MKNNDDWFWWIVYAIGIAFILLIIGLCGVSMKLSPLSHENEILVAQKETLEENILSRIVCARGNEYPQIIERFKYDPNTGSIYDNETKEIYRKVNDEK